MTQPNPFLPQQPAPQQAPQAGPVNPYAQQPQPAAAPNPYAQPQQYAAAPAPQQYVPQQTAPGNGLVAAPGQFMRPGPPPPPGQGNGPRVADLKARLLLIMPERCDRGIASKFTNDDGTPRTQDKMIATVVVLDGGPIAWGQSPQNPQGTQAQVPHVIKNLWIQQTGLIAQLEQALALRLQGGPGLALGRLWQAGTAKNDPYVLADPQPQDVAIYDHYVSQVNPFSL